MRKHAKTLVFRALLCLGWPGISLACLGQEIAFTGQASGQVSSRGPAGSPRKENGSPDLSISLKDAINQLKKFYSIKIAYRQGLLDGKTIPAAMMNDMKMQDPETALKKLLQNLLRKKLRRKQS